MRAWTRRRVLRGTGTLAGLCLGLPVLESVVRGGGPLGAPLENFVLFHFPNGPEMTDWLPDAIGAGFELPAQLSPIEDLSDRFSLVSGLSSLGARDPTSEPPGGPHSVPSMNFLTGVAYHRDLGPRSPSVDAVVSANLNQVPEPHLYLATHAQGGRGLSWSEGEGLDKNRLPLVQPSVVFDRLFAAGVDTAAADRLRARRESILDYVKSDLGRLRKELSAVDHRRVDDHLDAVRELELKAKFTVECDEPATPPEDSSGMVPLEDIPARLELLIDFAVLALRCELTHSVVVSAGPSLNAIDYPFLNAPTDIHRISHLLAGENEPTQEEREEVSRFWLREVTRWNVGMFGRLMRGLMADGEVGPSLLDRSALVCASEMSYGAVHSRFNIPVLVAGGSVPGGRHIHYNCNLTSVGDASGDWSYFGRDRLCTDPGVATPLANLWLTAIQALGIDAPGFGESTGTLSGLWLGD